MLAWNLLELSAVKLAELLRSRQISSVELVTAHLEQIGKVNPVLNAVVELLRSSALESACAADARSATKESCGPLNGVPFSIKDSIDVKGTRCIAGTTGRMGSAIAEDDATVVRRLREAGGIPIAKTNLPDLLFSFETDNLPFGRTNNPYDLGRTPGGSSGGESALIAACGSPLGLGSDAFGSVRLPSAFCGMAGIKPTSGRLPRTGHVPPLGGWTEAVWQIGPMARWTEDLQLAMRLLAKPDERDFTSPPMPLFEAQPVRGLRVAFFTDNGIVPANAAVRAAIVRCAEVLEQCHAAVQEERPPGVERAYELEFSILGSDGAKGIDEYLCAVGSKEQHWLSQNFIERLRAQRCSASELSARWAAWDRYRADMKRFFARFDAVISPVYPEPALPHGASALEENFKSFSYTMAWNMAGAPAATVRCGEEAGLPINVQVIAAPWQDLTAIEICRVIEEELGGWKPAAQFTPA